MIKIKKYEQSPENLNQFKLQIINNKQISYWKNFKKDQYSNLRYTIKLTTYKTKNDQAFPTTESPKNTGWDPQFYQMQQQKETKQEKKVELQ